MAPRPIGLCYTFSTALPPSILAAAATAVQLIDGMDSQRNALRRASAHLRSELRQCGWEVRGKDSPILPLMCGAEVAALTLSEQLRAANLFVPAIRPPTVPIGSSRLRVSLSVEHSTNQLHQLCSELIRNHQTPLA